MRRPLLTILFTLLLLEMVACAPGSGIPEADGGSAENVVPLTIELLESANFDLNPDTFSVIYDADRGVTCWIVWQTTGYAGGLGMHCLKGKH